MFEIHNDRLHNIIDTSNLIEPSYVPIMSNILTWSATYAGVQTSVLLEQPELIPDVCTQYFKDVYFDACLHFGISTAIKAINTLGGKSFFVSSDGYSIQHSGNCHMREDEYDHLINKTKSFLIDELGMRKFPSLNTTEEEGYKILIDVVRYIDRFSIANKDCREVAKNKYGIVAMVDYDKIYAPMDVIFDRLRGIEGTFLDMYRHENDLLMGIQALYPLCLSRIHKTEKNSPYKLCTLHCPTYLSKEKFEKFFWPTARKLLLEVYNKGAKTLMFMEGTWKPFFEIMKRDLPKASVLCLLEDDDIVHAKKTIGDYFTVIGGVKTSLLRFGNKNTCLDEAKRILDECAPGGGFIFSTEKAICSAGDINIDNLIAVNEFVHTYGRY